VSRGRALHQTLHAAQASHSTIDRQLDAKLLQIADLERALDSIENEAHRLGPTPPKDSTGLRNTLQRLKVYNFLFLFTVPNHKNKITCIIIHPQCKSIISTLG
jgi:hypothetical protein